jgi:hypothetical protein
MMYMPDPKAAGQSSAANELPSSAITNEVCTTIVAAALWMLLSLTVQAMYWARSNQ